MIREFSSRVKPTNRKASFFAFLALTLFAVSVAVYLSLDKYRGIVGLFALAFIAVTVLLYTKYVIAEYFYEITFDSFGSAVFVVRQRVGKKDTTLCRLDLHNIVRIEKQSREERAKHNTPYGYVKYVYVPTFLPTDTHLIVAASRYEKAEITIECPDEFAAVLSSYAEEAKEIHKTSEDAEEY